MKIDVKFKRIGTRWAINIFLIVVAVVCAATVALTILFNAVYIDRIKGLASDYAYDFYALSSSTADTLADSAIEMADEFEYKNLIEVEVLDTEGRIIVSTTGFQAQDNEMPDYEKAMSAGEFAVQKCRTASGERVLAGTEPIRDIDGKTIGAYRWVTSLKSYDRMSRNFLLVLIGVSVCILAISVFSGIFFIKSIVRPIKEASNMARKIAMGDFESRIDVERIDEIGELCDAVNYMASELTRAESLKNDFISSVSHELRTPLTAIRGWGETAKMSIGTDDELVSRGLDVVLSEADRLSGLVEELLDFSRIQTGRMTVVTKPINVSELLWESADMYAELAKKQGIELVITKPSEELKVMGDTDRLKQVFINIIDNAVKYTESGGQVLISQLKEEGCVRIVVKDTGVGIPAQDIDRVKEKFYKANKTVRGSGIGLAVADEIIKMHKGLLFIESTEGVGTTATIVLPIYEHGPEPDSKEEAIDEFLEEAGETAEEKENTNG